MKLRLEAYSEVCSTVNISTDVIQPSIMLSETEVACVRLSLSGYSCEVMSD